MISKRADTSQIATLVALIALFIVAYIILIPEESRRELLGEEKIPKEEGVFVKNLLIESPGLVYPYSKEQIKRGLASVNLFSTVETDVIMLTELLKVSRNIFVNDYQDSTFELDDLGVLKKLEIFFNIRGSRGDLVLTLNGKEVYRGKVTSGVLPIELPLTYLRKSNILRVESASPGWMFLMSNYHELKDVQLIKKYSLENKKEVRSFVLKEGYSINEAELNYFLNCMEISETGTLEISLNRHNVFIGKVVCDASQSLAEIPLDYFVSGKNSLIFEIDKGNYVIEQLELGLTVDKGYTPTYSFDLGEEDFDKITGKFNRVNLVMDFDGTGGKKATVMVNNERFYLDTSAGLYFRDISDSMRVGENFIKIIPKTEFNIANLEVNLVK